MGIKERVVCINKAKMSALRKLKNKKTLRRFETLETDAQLINLPVSRCWYSFLHIKRGIYQRLVCINKPKRDRCKNLPNTNEV
jgi:hypothetical protein